MLNIIHTTKKPKSKITKIFAERAVRQIMENYHIQEAAAATAKKNGIRRRSNKKKTKQKVHKRKWNSFKLTNYGNGNHHQSRTHF